MNILEMLCFFFSVFVASGRPILEPHPDRAPYLKGSEVNVRLQGLLPGPSTAKWAANFMNIDQEVELIYEHLTQDPPDFDRAYQQSYEGTPDRRFGHFDATHGRIGQEHQLALALPNPSHSVIIEKFYGSSYLQSGYESPMERFVAGSLLATANFSEGATDDMRIRHCMKASGTWLVHNFFANYLDKQTYLCETGSSDFYLLSYVLPAMYMGSMEQSPVMGPARGIALYAHCHMNCPYFDTCHSESSTNTLNLKALQLAEFGLDQIKQAKSDWYTYWGNKMFQRFHAMMAQGILLAAHKLSLGEDATEDCVWAAGLLPWIHHCSTSASSVIQKNLQCSQEGSMMVDGFATVRDALESVYLCLGIVCDEIGIGIKTNPGDSSFAESLCGGYVGSHSVDSLSQIDFLDPHMQAMWDLLELPMRNFSRAQLYYESNIGKLSLAQLGVAPGGTLTYDKFADYHGGSDYAKQFVLGALNGNGLFNGINEAARALAIKRSIVGMNMWMSVTGMLEDAANTCELALWEQAMVLYGDGQREAVYRLANTLCLDFKTCANNGDLGTAAANVEIMNLFETEATKIKQNDCSATHDIVVSIVSWMSVPLIQGALRAAYGSAVLQKGLLDQVEGAVFAAAVLPLVDKCDATAARIISDSMAMNKKGVVLDFATVKQAFESIYSCLGIRCMDVGGFLKDTQNYSAGAAPCMDETGSDAEASDANAARTFHVNYLLNVLPFLFCFLVDGLWRNIFMAK